MTRNENSNLWQLHGLARRGLTSLPTRPDHCDLVWEDESEKDG